MEDHKQATKMVQKKSADLAALESKLDPDRLKALIMDRAANDGSQYRAVQIDAPTRAKSLKAIVEAEANAEASATQKGTRRRGIRGNDSTSRGSLVNLGITLETRL